MAVRRRCGDLERTGGSSGCCLLPHPPRKPSFRRLGNRLSDGSLQGLVVTSVSEFQPGVPTKRQKIAERTRIEPAHT